MGKSGGLPERLDAEDEAVFPELEKAGYRVTSPKDPTYNCVAFAAGDTTRKWSSTLIPVPGYYWPPGADEGDGLEALQGCFEQIGYELCKDRTPEQGYEKVVLYVDADGMWSHAAKLEENGEWTSKLGEIEDIRHQSEHCFATSIYGNVACYILHEAEEVSDVCSSYIRKRAVRISGKRVRRTRFIEGGRFVVALDVEMVIPSDDPSEPCYESETVALLKEVAERAESGDKPWLLKHGRVYERVAAE